MSKDDAREIDPGDCPADTLVTSSRPNGTRTLAGTGKDLGKDREFEMER